jgi:Uma2 family endonuclease
MATVTNTTSLPSLPTFTDIPLLPPASDGRVRFSREAYHRMLETGVLDDQKHYELIDGEIVMTPPIGPGQGDLISQLMDFFVRRIPDVFQCRIQLPIVVNGHSEPEPDLAIVRRRESRYQSEHPSPTDVVLLIEVSQSSLSRDRGQKMQLYARSAIPEYWIVDVEHRIVIVHRQPEPLGYSDVQQFNSRATIAPLAAPECQLDLDWLFR